MRPDATRQRIALFGNFGTGNLGNEATLQAMLYNLRSHLPNAEISCICPGPENTAIAVQHFRCSDQSTLSDLEVV